MALTVNRYYVVAPQAAVNYVQWPRFDDLIKDFEGYNGAVIAMSDEKTRRGYSSLKISSAGSARGAWYNAVLPGPIGVDSVLSLDIWAGAGISLTLSLCNSAGTAVKNKAITGTGYWNRVSIVRDFAGDVTFKVTMNSTASTAVYVDGVQYEAGSEPTTFFDRWTTGEERNSTAYSGKTDANGKWLHYRSGRTRSGGRLVDLSDYGTVQADFGSGMGPFEQVYTEMASGGSFYQGLRNSPRALALSIAVTGDDSSELYHKRNELMKLIAPDRFDTQPLIIRYQGFDENGIEATEPINYYCTLEPSLSNTPELPGVQKDVLNFTVMGGFAKGAYLDGGKFSLDQKFTSNCCIMRDYDGVWVSMDTAGTVGQVWDVVLGPDNRIYACGSGGIWRWEDDEWVDLGIIVNAGAMITAMTFSPSNDLIFGGSFTQVGGKSIPGIARAVLSAEGGAPTIHAFGTGLHTSGSLLVDAIAFDPQAIMYIGGDFEDAGGVANTRMVAKWNGSAWQAMSGSPMTGRVRALAMVDQRRLLVGGDFTNFAGTSLMSYLMTYDTVAKNWKSFPNTSKLDAPVWDISVKQSGTAIISGGFTKAGTKNCSRVATVVNDAIFPLASGFEAGGGPGSTPIWSVSAAGQRVYAGSVGSVTNLGRRVGEIAEYVNNAWRPVDLDLPDSLIVYKILAFATGELVIAGSWAGEITTNGLTKSKQNVFDYQGSAVTYPTITIVGPYTLKSISNYTTHKTLNFKDFVIHPGESVELGLDPLHLYGKSSWKERGNVLSYLWDGSDVGHFEMDPGENWIGITGETPAGGTPKAYLTWPDVLWGAEGSIRYAV